MESSSSNLEESELQLMRLEERQVHSKGMAWFKELKSHLETLHNNRTQFKEFFDSKEVNALDFHNQCWQKHFKDYTRCEPETCRRNLLRYLEEFDKLIDERIQESLVTEGAALEASFVTGGISLDSSLVAKQSTVDSSTSSEHQNECNSSRNECSRSGNENISSDNKSGSSGNDADANIEPSYDSDIVSEDVFINSSFEDNVKRIARNRLSEEFEPLVKDVNLQLNCFEKGLVKEMKDDLNHVYENEMFKQIYSLENEDRCLKKTITELLKQAADVKEKMTKRCTHYEKDFAKLEAHCISLELKSQKNYLKSLQNGHVLSDKSDEAKIKFDTEDLETINIELEFSVASLPKPV
ncbi:hypothetical protein Tco_0327769 [Tanacetum coccineum]